MDITKQQQALAMAHAENVIASVETEHGETLAPALRRVMVATLASEIVAAEHREPRA